MRPIEFRGKDAYGNWLYGMLVYNLLGKLCIQSHTRLNPNIPHKLYEIFEVNPDTVCQYTGSEDKNGNKIFEGDICTDINDGSIFSIVFEESAFRDSKKGYALANGYLPSVDFIIIGNIFDNPELLEAKNG